MSEFFLCGMFIIIVIDFRSRLNLNVIDFFLINLIFS